MNFKRLAMLFLICGCSREEPSLHVDFLWRPESIRFAIERDDKYRKIGQYLLLEQSLRNEEAGWTMKRIDIPEAWVVHQIGFVGSELILSLSDGRDFTLGPSNIGELGFAILDGGTKSESELENLWSQHARLVGGPSPTMN